MNNRAALGQTLSAGCYHCARVFVASRIVKWTDNEQTALCPFCGIDSVLPSAVSHDFLRRARAHWFDKEVQA